MIIERSVWNELKCTDRMSYALKVIALSMGKVVHRVGVPFSSCTVVRNVDNAIDDRIAEVHVGICHIQFCTEHHTTLNGFWCIHLFKEFQRLFYRTISIRRSYTRSCRCTFLFCNLFCCLLINVGMSFSNHPNRKIPQLFKIV